MDSRHPSLRQCFGVDCTIWKCLAWETWFGPVVAQCGVEAAATGAARTYVAWTSWWVAKYYSPNQIPVSSVLHMNMNQTKIHEFRA